MSIDRRWEEDIYARGRQINRYPFDPVVAFVLSRFGGVPDRSRVRFLEIGCGAGNNVWFLANEGFAVTGVDGSSSALEHAWTRLGDLAGTVELRVGDITRLDLTDGSHDGAIDRGALTHNRREDARRGLFEVARVLKPGGLLFSQMFSSADSGRRHGHAHGDGSYDHFTGGYFEGLPLTLFLDSADVDELFTEEFVIESKVHAAQTEELDGTVTATWNVICRRRS